MPSVDLTNAAAYKAYVERFHDQLLFKLFHGFPTAQAITPHEGVKGRLVLTEFTLGDIVRRWAAAFNPLADAMSFDPRVLEVAAAKVDISINPQELEETYLGMARRPGFNHQELPYEAFILQRLIAKINETMEKAVWQGVAAAVPDPGDTLLELFDGFLQIIADEITATTISPVTTGAITVSNAVASIESMWDALDDAHKEGEVEIFVSHQIKQFYLRNYRADHGYGLMTEDGTGRVRLDFGNAFLRSVPGLTGSGRVIMTPASNLRYGYDSAMDASMFHIQQLHRALDFWCDFKLGVQIGIVADGHLVVNDQT